MAESRCFKVLTFIVGALAMSVLSVVAAFNVYANALKSRFNYTQSEVESFASLGVVGQFFGIPAGMLFHSFGPRVTSSIGLVLTVAGFMLVWMAIKLNYIFKAYSFAVSMFFLVGMHGTAYTYLGFLLSNMGLFGDVHRGKIVAALNTLYQAPIFPFIYNLVFIGKDKINHADDDLEGFFLTIAICFGVVNLLGIAVLRKAPRDNLRSAQIKEDEETKPMLHDDIITDRKGYENEGTSKSLEADEQVTVIREESLCSIFKSWSFQFAMWIPVISFGVNIAYLTNITVILHSLDMDVHQPVFTVVCPLIGLVASFSLCTLSSRFAKKLRPSILVLVLISLQAISQVVLIFFLNNFPVFLTCTIIQIISALAIFSLVPTIMITKLGAVNFNRAWGYVLVMTSLSTIALLKVFGAIYDSYIIEGETNCLGTYCYTYCFIVQSVVCACAVLFTVGLVEKGW